MELLDHLELPSAAVVSLSAGSMTAAQLAARHPDRVRVLVLESPVLPTSTPLRQPPEAVFRRLARSERLFWLTSSLPQAVAKGSGVSWKKLGEPARDELRTIMQTMTPVRVAVVLLQDPAAAEDVVQSCSAAQAPRSGRSPWPGRPHP